MFGIDHFFVFFISSLDFNNEKRLAQNFYKDAKSCSRTVLKERFASTDWRAMYQHKIANFTLQILCLLQIVLLENRFND